MLFRQGFYVAPVSVGANSGVMFRQGFYVAPVSAAARSRTTVQLRLSAGAEMEKQFLQQADLAGFKSLKGHR